MTLIFCTLPSKFSMMLEFDLNASLESPTCDYVAFLVLHGLMAIIRNLEMKFPS